MNASPAVGCWCWVADGWWLAEMNDQLGSRFADACSTTNTWEPLRNCAGFPERPQEPMVNHHKPVYEALAHSWKAVCKPWLQFLGSWASSMTGCLFHHSPPLSLNNKLMNITIHSITGYKPTITIHHHQLSLHNELIANIKPMVGMLLINELMVDGPLSLPGDLSSIHRLWTNFSSLFITINQLFSSLFTWLTHYFHALLKLMVAADQASSGCNPNACDRPRLTEAQC